MRSQWQRRIVNYKDFHDSQSFFCPSPGNFKESCTPQTKNRNIQFSDNNHYISICIHLHSYFINLWRENNSPLTCFHTDNPGCLSDIGPLVESERELFLSTGFPYYCFESILWIFKYVSIYVENLTCKYRELCYCTQFSKWNKYSNIPLHYILKRYHSYSKLLKSFPLLWINFY